MLRTRAPVAGSIATPLPLDLHVLGLPLAFILSQDQTLHCKISLHHGEPWLMSSANPTRIDEFDVFVLRLSFLLLSLLKAALTICLFQSFKERIPAQLA